MVGAEFLGMIILIVYVGAVAVLFLFVVMMLNVAEQKQSWFIGKKSTHIPTGLIISVLIFLELLVVVGGWKYKDDFMSSQTLELSSITNTHQIGLVMYTDYILYFQLAGSHTFIINDWRNITDVSSKTRGKKTELFKTNF